MTREPPWFDAQTGLNEANQFVTLARDGKLLFWDIRVKKDKKTGEIVWTPLYSCLLTRLEVPGDLSGHSFSFSVVEVCHGPPKRAQLYAHASSNSEPNGEMRLRFHCAMRAEKDVGPFASVGLAFEGNTTVHEACSEAHESA
jgi:hypothetical protein